MRPHLPPRRWFVLLAVALPLLFAWYTNHAWEDYYITLRSSRNLVTGHGLVFNPGERVHTFTSPLGVLLPAFCTWVAGPAHESLALWLFRLINLGLLGCAARLVWNRMESLGLGTIGLILGFALLFANSRLVDFSINGMETAVLVFFVLSLWQELERPEGPRTLPVAVGCAGLLWTRPDGVILGIALIFAHVAIRPRREQPPPIRWRRLITGILAGGALYAPWFGWAWWYYGSPVPHTIIAKAQISASPHLSEVLLVPWHTLVGPSSLADLFLPTYWAYGDWPAGLRSAGHVLALIGAAGWLIPNLPGAVRRLSLAVFLGSFYLGAIMLYPWYTPPWTALAALAIAGTFDHVARWAQSRQRIRLGSVLRVATALVVAGQAGVLVATAWEMRVQQRVIEDGVRRPIGEWLGHHAQPGDTVFLEPLGYIGYFSGLKTYDFPGLSSPAVVAALRDCDLHLAQVLARLQPTWMVLRPWEFADPASPENALLRRDYTLVNHWSAWPRLDATAVLPGRAWLEYDAEYLVYRRRQSPATTSTRTRPAPGA